MVAAAAAAAPLPARSAASSSSTPRRRAARSRASGASSPTAAVPLPTPVADAVPGPYLLATNSSTSLFSEPFRQAYTHFTNHCAVFLHADQDKPNYSTDQLYLPHLHVMESVRVDPPHAFHAVTKISDAATNQKALIKWIRLRDLQRTILSQLRAAFPELDRRLTHLAQTCSD